MAEDEDGQLPLGSARGTPGLTNWMGKEANSLPGLGGIKNSELDRFS